MPTHLPCMPRAHKRRRVTTGRRLSWVRRILVLAGLGGAIAHAAEGDGPPACRGLDATQAGQVVPAADGVITLARQPFVLRLQTDGFAPGLHVARDGRLAAALAASPMRRLWLSAGDVIATEPGQLLIDGGFTVKDHGGGSSSAFAAAFGDRAVRLLGPGAGTVALPMLAGEIPRQAFAERDGPTGRHLHAVNRIADQPVERSTVPELHLVVFAARQGFPSEPASMFTRSEWAACVLRWRH